MNKNNVGEFEELVLLTVLILHEDAYILKIQEELLNRANRKAAMGPIHVTLGRLEKKGYVTSELAGGKKERGGRRKRIYQLTSSGKSVLALIRETRNSLWNQVPEFALKLVHA